MLPPGLRRSADRSSWRSLTPEPERELPWAVAALRARAAPDPIAVTAERARIEALVVRGGERAWLSYLRSVVVLIEQCSHEAMGPVALRARAVALAVLTNHHGLLLGLPSRAAERTIADRARLAAAAAPASQHPPRAGRTPGTRGYSRRPLA